jgi:hypothetical protein
MPTKPQIKPSIVPLTTLEADGRRFNVSIHTAWDGIEYVGRLWFADDSWEDMGFPDRGAFPGRTPEEVMVLAARLRPEDVARRYQRALAEKRRFHGLRRATDDVLAKIRYLNQVALSMRAGLLDAEGAAQEIDLTEKQLHELVAELKVHAGITAEPGE